MSVKSCMRKQCWDFGNSTLVKVNTSLGEACFDRPRRAIEKEKTGVVVAPSTASASRAMATEAPPPGGEGEAPEDGEPEPEPVFTLTLSVKVPHSPRSRVSTASSPKRLLSVPKGAPF